MEPKSLTIKYFAVLKDKSGKSSESIKSEAESPRELFTVLNERYQFNLDPRFIKVAVNDEFCDWTSPLKSGDEVVFMTPVAGG